MAPRSSGWAIPDRALRGVSGGLDRTDGADRVSLGVGGIVLKVIIHDDDVPPSRSFQAGHERVVLAEIPAKVQTPQASVPAAEFDDLGPALIWTAVVDQDDLKWRWQASGSSP
jgi:hypothetical protein